MKDWRNLLNTSFDRELEKVAVLFTPLHTQSSIGDSLNDLATFNGEFILVGGLARRFHSSPRNTGDIDLFFRNESSLQDFLTNNTGKYRKIRNHAILILGTEVDLLTPEFLGVSSILTDYIFDTKESTGMGIDVTSKEAIILMKLERMSPTDDNDIRALIESGGKNLKVNDILDLSGPQKEVIKKILDQSKMFLKE